ncbi:hypothetical protein AB0958_09670 [Streptomyces sp. NPDC006655]|uniref:hypothetical protein n=1 Tax=Streptomyces sp. NPDC006655 TaxID=3156898 RepID=UPI0034538FDD
MVRLSLAGTGLHRYSRQHCRHDRDAARAEVLRLEAVIRGLDTTVIEQGERIAQLEADAVDVSVERQLRERAEEHAAEVEQEFLALKARVDNEHAISVPRWRRPVDEDDKPTEPAGIEVRTLREAFAARTA